jgi:hypothetical protein
MTILKAIEKAYAAGWRTPDLNQNATLDAVMEDAAGITCQFQVPHAVIFDREFAKALWGDAVPDEAKGLPAATPSLWTYDNGMVPDFKGKYWEYHLQEMVVSEDPLKYLEENL